MRELFTDDDEPAQRAKDEAAGPRGKLTEATESFLKPRGGISADRLAQIEQTLAPQIAEADRRSVVSAKAPMALLSAAEFGAEKVRPEWDGLPVAAQREVLRLLFDDNRVGKPVHTLTRWSTDKDRLAAAAARMRVRWREPGTPVAVPDQPGPEPGAGGARAQRRRKTSIDLLTGRDPRLDTRASRPRPRRGSTCPHSKPISRTNVPTSPRHGRHSNACGSRPRTFTQALGTANSL